MPDAPPLVVACLCAAWCGVCREYRASFDAAAARHAALARFVWIDIEDEADRLAEVEVDAFPTLVIARRGEPLFAGPVGPQPALLDRLVVEAGAGHLVATTAPGPGIEALAASLDGPGEDRQRGPDDARMGR